MMSKEIQRHNRSPQEFEQLILAYQTHKSEINALLEQQRVLERTIESKFGLSSLNISYEFPRAPSDSISRESSHPSLLASNFNLNSYGKKVMEQTPAPQPSNNTTLQSGQSAQLRRIMNVKDIRQLVRNTANKQNDECEKIRAQGNTTSRKGSPKSSKRQIKSISKELIREIKSYEEGRATGGLKVRNFTDIANRTERKIKLELSIDHKRGHPTDRQRNAGVETPKTKEEVNSTGLRRIQSFKNIVQSNRKQQDKAQPHTEKPGCLDCPDEPSWKTKPKGTHKASLNLFVQRREIKIITAGKLDKSGEGHALQEHQGLRHNSSQAEIDQNQPTRPKAYFTGIKSKGGLARIEKGCRH